MFTVIGFEIQSKSDYPRTHSPSRLVGAVKVTVLNLIRRQVDGIIVCVGDFSRSSLRRLANKGCLDQMSWSERVCQSCGQMSTTRIRVSSTAFTRDRCKKVFCVGREREIQVNVAPIMAVIILASVKTWRINSGSGWTMDTIGQVQQVVNCDCGSRLSRTKIYREGFGTSQLVCQDSQGTSH